MTAVHIEAVAMLFLAFSQIVLYGLMVKVLRRLNRLGDISRPKV